MLVALAVIFGGGMACARYDDGSVGAFFVKVVGMLLFAPSLLSCLDKEDRAWVYRILTRLQPRIW